MKLLVGSCPGDERKGNKESIHILPVSDYTNVLPYILPPEKTLGFHSIILMKGVQFG